MINVAVYGSLLSGLGNHCLLKESNCLGTDETTEGFTMFDLGYYPGIKENGETAVKVEVYEVDEATFGRLDQLEGYPSFYNRKQISTKYGDAWIYFLSEGYDYEEEVVSGDWRAHYEEKW